MIIMLLLTGLCGSSDSAAAPNWLTTHFQQTLITQGDPGFHADYSGPNSLDPSGEQATSFTSTLFLGAKLWTGGELYVNPEASGGKGLSGATGVAGFVNGETYRIGDPTPSWDWTARLFLRQTFNFGPATDTVADGQNQVSTLQSGNRLVVTAGKWCLADVFDANGYSHDPRSQFMNWSLMSQGAWDYPANTHGYTWALALEYDDGPWAVRAATAAEPKSANGMGLEYRPGEAQGQVVEIERDYAALGGKGALRVLSYLNLYHGGSYAEALQDTGTPDVVQSREYGRTKFGFALNWEHQWSPVLGTFARGGWSDGHNETWAFTEIDRSVSAGAQLNGTLWGRSRDRFGLAGVVNGLSQAHEDYLAHGGLGFMIGDGALSYAPESILEAYYAAALLPWLTVSPDWQFVTDPGYNRDRGPVSVYALRVHAEI
jgi:high affinity Mn2+ porin